MQERASLCRVVTSFKKTAQADGSIKVAVGDMLADEQKDFLVELELPGFSIPDVTLTVLELHARYLDVCSACMREITFQASILRTTDTAGLRPSHPLILVSPVDGTYLLWCSASQLKLLQDFYSLAPMKQHRHPSWITEQFLFEAYAKI